MVAMQPYSQKFREQVLLENFSRRLSAGVRRLRKRGEDVGSLQTGFTAPPLEIEQVLDKYFRSIHYKTGGSS